MGDEKSPNVFDFHKSEDMRTFYDDGVISNKKKGNRKKKRKQEGIL